MATRREAAIIRQFEQIRDEHAEKLADEEEEETFLAVLLLGLGMTMDGANMVIKDNKDLCKRYQGLVEALVAVASKIKEFEQQAKKNLQYRRETLPRIEKVLQYPTPENAVEFATTSIKRQRELGMAGKRVVRMRKPD